MNKNFKYYSFIILLLVLFLSCQTRRTIIPTITSVPRSELRLPRPIIISIKDSREEVSNGEEVINTLQNNLKKIYGNNIIFKSYFDKTDKNSVTIRLNIKKIEATFGTRTIHYRSIYNQTLAVSNSISNHWGSAVSTTIISQPIYQDNFIAEGYWVGTSYIDIEFVDNIQVNKQIYRFPFVAEDSEINTWGYKTANKVANKSWNKLSSHLLDLIDSISIAVVEYNNQL